MYSVVRKELEFVKILEEHRQIKTVFTTYEWLNFLAKNQKVEPVILELVDEENVVAYFVGCILKKKGIKILGSPFEGWLTCDMGFISIGEYDINRALKTVAKYAFKNLKCLYLQIADNSIKDQDLNKDIKRYYEKLLYIDSSPDIEQIINGFTKNGRRDVRASARKGLIIEKVPFNKAFIDLYYDQLIDVFAKQNLKPFYDKQKLYDLSYCFKDSPHKVMAAVAKNENGESVATVFSFSSGKWAYYVGAASYRDYQKLLPNEALFIEFVKHWHDAGIGNLDLVGYREYKMKYNPQIIEVPVVYFERIFGIFLAKKIAKKITIFLRKIRGK